MSLVVSANKTGDTCVVTVAGEVDVSNADELRTVLNEVLDSGVSAIEVDLGEVPYIDSTGIGVLVGVSRRAADASVSLRVANPQRNVARVLSLLGVGDELGVSL
ncbi:MAG: STAS domain-containing protein [Atopobiaceae bacterium]|nr:STAS domain-containing protein [Atopobiaceae bacterium]